MDITIIEKNDSIRLALHGDVDEKGSAVLNKRFQETISKNTIRELVLDFHDVAYIGSSGIGLLILFYQSLAAVGGKVHIENVSAAIYDLFLELDIPTILTVSKIR